MPDLEQYDDKEVLETAKTVLNNFGRYGHELDREEQALKSEDSVLEYDGASFQSDTIKDQEIKAIEGKIKTLLEESRHT